jgi:hypothetical protein
MRKNILFILFTTCILFLFLVLVNSGKGDGLHQDKLEAFRQVSDFVDENEECFRCHGELKFQLADNTMDRVLTRHIARIV